MIMNNEWQLWLLMNIIIYSKAGGLFVNISKVFWMLNWDLNIFIFFVGLLVLLIEQLDLHWDLALALVLVSPLLFLLGWLLVSIVVFVSLDEIQGDLLVQLLKFFERGQTQGLIDFLHYIESHTHHILTIINTITNHQQILSHILIGAFYYLLLHLYIHMLGLR